MFMFMTPARTALGATRAAIGLGAILAPDLTIRVFGMDDARSNRFVSRLFGTRELGLALALLAAPPKATRAVALTGSAIDAADALLGFDERRRGTLGTRATLLGPVGAVGFAVLGALVAHEAAGDPA